MPYSETLKRWRESKGKSRKDLATDIGVTPEYICLIEAGRSQPGPKTRAAIKFVLDIDDDAFIAWENQIDQAKQRQNADRQKTQERLHSRAKKHTQEPRNNANDIEALCDFLRSASPMAHIAQEIVKVLMRS